MTPDLSVVLREVRDVLDQPFATWEPEPPAWLRQAVDILDAVVGYEALAWRVCTTGTQIHLTAATEDDLSSAQATAVCGARNVWAYYMHLDEVRTSGMLCPRCLETASGSQRKETKI